MFPFICNGWTCYIQNVSHAIICSLPKIRRIERHASTPRTKDVRIYINIFVYLKLDQTIISYHQLALKLLIFCRLLSRKTRDAEMYAYGGGGAAIWMWWWGCEWDVLLIKRADGSNAINNILWCRTIIHLMVDDADVTLSVLDAARLVGGEMSKLFHSHGLCDLHHVEYAVSMILS